MPSYIPDGYAESAYIQAAPGLHGALHFRYRLSLTEEIEEYFEGADKLSAKAQTDRSRRLLAAKLISWDLTAPDGRAVAWPDGIDQRIETLKRVARPLFYRLTAIVSGVQAPDEDPAASAEEKKGGAA